MKFALLASTVAAGEIYSFTAEQYAKVSNEFLFLTFPSWGTIWCPIGNECGFGN